jgi:hypothetical protein
MMLSGLAALPWLTEIVKLGSGPELELPPVTSQTTAPMTAASTTAVAV